MYILAAKHLNTIEVMSFSASIQTTVNLPIVRQLGTRDKLQKMYDPSLKFKLVPYQ